MAPKTLAHLSSTDLIQKTRRIEIKTSRLVNELIGGRYLSTFKGRGMEFLDVRDYTPGDDIRDIHWIVTARLGQPYIKRYTEERELTILIAVDVSKSTQFGTRQRFKSELAAELVSLLAFSSLKNNDKVGLLLFSDQVESYIPPRKTKSHALRLVRDVLGFEPKNARTNIDQALQYLNRVQKRKAIVFIISDFLDTDFEKSLSTTQKHHDTISFVLEDPLEQHWPAVGRVCMDDAETGERQWINFSDPTFKHLFQGHINRLKRSRERIFSKINMDQIILRTNEDYIRPLMAFFKLRRNRIH